MIGQMLEGMSLPIRQSTGKVALMRKLCFIL
jgi:hypothetical protein